MAALFGLQPDRRALMRDRLAQQMFAQGADASPVGHWTQGAARLAQALMGGYLANRGDEDEKKREGDYASGLNAALMGAAGPGDIATRLSGSGNPDLARLAPDFTLKEIEAQQKKREADAKAEAAKALREWEYKNDPGKRYKTVGANLLDMTAPDPMKPVYTAPRENTGAVAEYEFAKTQGFKGSLLDYKKAADDAGRKPEGEGGGPFKGTALDAQAWNLVLNPQADPSSPEYAAAHSHLTQPKLQMVPGPDGQAMMSLVTPTLPPNIRKPTHMQQAAQATAPGVPPVAGVPASPAPAAPDLPPPTNVPGLSVQPMSPPKAPQLNEGQANAALYADRMRAAEPIISAKAGEGLSLRNRAASSVPVAGNYMVTPGYQQLEQAQRDFINATLRRESGAVISPSEFDNAAKQYFPQPGDSPETMAQKARNRKVAADGIARAAGPAYKPTSPAETIRTWNPATGKLE